MAFYDYEIWKMDIKITFLNGYLNEDIYMVQLEGFVDPNHPRKVCKLQRSIYGLKQTSSSWNKIYDEEIKSDNLVMVVPNLEGNGVDDEGFIDLKRKKLGGNDRGKKNFKPVLLKLKSVYRQVKQSAKGMRTSPKTTPFVVTNKATTSCYKKDFTKKSSKKVMGNKATTSSTKAATHNLGSGSQITTLQADEISDLERKMLDGKLVIMDNDEKPLKSIKQTRSLSRYGINNLLELWKETLVDDDYDPYDDELYDEHVNSEVPHGI
uniref:Reverse transcriptase n=1 Tax=Tanacetum cinerariifolium TaxID=118510 RepID=A0A6L2J914_TANCI|nr:reverse transcriptase [Tanacetum cinerariifolium]